MSGESQVTELTSLSLKAAGELVRDKLVSPVELTTACLRRIEERNPRLNAFITVNADSALAQARLAETEIARGNWLGPLHGIPIALKDLIDTAGVRTTAASAVFLNRVPREDAEVVRRLKGAGAVLIGNTNLHEFAYGGSSIISYFGPVRNPIDPERIPGGSSGGSAVAVAAGMCYAALGTDTAGSIRLPSCLCGVVGLKPSYGLVSVRGVIPLVWSCDHVGPIARTVADAALVLEVIAGYDPGDPNSRQLPLPRYADVEAQRPTVKTFRLGVLRDYFFDDLHPEVAQRVAAAIEILRGIVHSVGDATIPVYTDSTINKVEAWTYHEEMIARSAELYQPETLMRLRAGSEFSAADYVRSRRALQQAQRECFGVFRNFDILVSPTSPMPAPSIAELQSDMPHLRDHEMVLLHNTRPFNALGLPSITVPCGTTSSGLPVGLQLAGNTGLEAALLAIAQEFESWMKARDSAD